MATLSEYLRDRKMSGKTFGELVNVSQATINRYCSGKRFPDKDMILRIESATKGKVRPADWYAQEPAE